MPDDCGCLVEFDGSQYPVPAVEIEYCPLHAAAPETARQRDALLVAFKAESDALFDVINGVKGEITAKGWMFEGRGPYQWDDDQYREEAGRAFEAMRAVVELAIKPARERYGEALKHAQAADVADAGVPR